jgi:hypothetical protein
MTMGPVEIERKVRQHDNDITEIYQMLAHIQGVQGRHTMRLGELGAALGIVDSKVDAVDHKVDPAGRRGQRARAQGRRTGAEGQRDRPEAGRAQQQLRESRHQDGHRPGAAPVGSRG